MAIGMNDDVDEIGVVEEYGQVIFVIFQICELILREKQGNDFFELNQRFIFSIQLRTSGAGFL